MISIIKATLAVKMRIIEGRRTIRNPSIYKPEKKELVYCKPHIMELSLEGKYMYVLITNKRYL